MIYLFITLVREFILICGCFFKVSRSCTSQFQILTTELNIKICFSLLIPINERGNSSTIIRMIHRQWYNAMLSGWDDSSSKPQLNLRFVLASPAAQSKASTLDRNFKDLRASTKRVLSDLPLDMLKNAQVEVRDPVDIVILLHSSFILLPQGSGLIRKNHPLIENLSYFFTVKAFQFRLKSFLIVFKAQIR